MSQKGQLISDDKEMHKVKFFLIIYLIIGLSGLSVGQDYNCVAKIVNNKNDSLFKNTRDYVINALKYKKLMQSTDDHNAALDSILRKVAKSDLTEPEQRVLQELISLSTNNVSGDVYSKAKVLDQQLIIKFNRYVPMTSLYSIDREFAKIARDFNSWASKICKFINQSIEYYDADHIMVNDSAFLSEVQLYEFKTDEIIADIGTGSGYFEIALSKFCDNLQVYANDIDSGSIGQLTTQFKFLDLNDDRNITYNTVLGNEKSTLLPAHRFDKVIIRNTFHHFKYPIEMLEDCKRIMKKNSRLFIVDILVDETDGSPVCPLHLTRSVFLNYLTNNGFVLTNETNLEYDHFKLFEFQLIP
jgi:ubiquinone/menaquinone biosynthesis C-methylase UbiE